MWDTDTAEISSNVVPDNDGLVTLVQRQPIIFAVCQNSCTAQLNTKGAWFGPDPLAEMYVDLSHWAHIYISNLVSIWISQALPATDIHEAPANVTAVAYISYSQVGGCIEWLQRESMGYERLVLRVFCATSVSTAT